MRRVNILEIVLSRLNLMMVIYNCSAHLMACLNPTKGIPAYGWTPQVCSVLWNSVWDVFPVSRLDDSKVLMSPIGLTLTLIPLPRLPQPPPPLIEYFRFFGHSDFLKNADLPFGSNSDIFEFENTLMMKDPP